MGFSMLYAMFGLVVFTYVYMLINFVWRYTAVKNRDMSIKYFRRLEGDQVPEKIALGSRHITNLFEVPVLFYVAGVLAVCLSLESPVMVGLAWAYVGCRLVHAFIHTTYNNVVHRMLIFHASCLVLLAIWVMLVVAYHNVH